MPRLASAWSVDESAFGVEPRVPLTTVGAATEVGSVRLWNLADPTTSPNLSTQIGLSREESDGVTAAASAARELSRAVPDEVKQRLYEEHGELVEKSFVHALSPTELTRLRYLRWQIDRLQDADIGDSLDRLDELAKLHKKVADEIAAFADHAAGVAAQRSNPRPRRSK